jgi:hypothetical protein
MTIGFLKIGQIFQRFFCQLKFAEWSVKITANGQGFKQLGHALPSSLATAAE